MLTLYSLESALTTVFLFHLCDNTVKMNGCEVLGSTSWDGVKNAERVGEFGWFEKGGESNCRRLP